MSKLKLNISLKSLANPIVLSSLGSLILLILTSTGVLKQLGLDSNILSGGLSIILTALVGLGILHSPQVGTEQAVKDTALINASNTVNDVITTSIIPAIQKVNNDLVDTKDSNDQ